MKASHRLNPGSSFQVGLVGSFRYPAVNSPLAFSIPAGFNTEPTDAETDAKICNGRHPISATFRMACAACLAPERLKKISAPEALRVIIWESTVGSVT